MKVTRPGGSLCFVATLNTTGSVLPSNVLNATATVSSCYVNIIANLWSSSSNTASGVVAGELQHRRGQQGAGDTPEISENSLLVGRFL